MNRSTEQKNKIKLNDPFLTEVEKIISNYDVKEITKY